MNWFTGQSTVEFTLAFLIFGFISYRLTGCYRHYALAKGVVDEPNQRSSHRVSTPRGGGISIVVCFLMLFALAAATDTLSVQASTAFMTSGAIVAAIGFIDDHRHVNSAARIFIHLLAVLLGILMLPQLPAITLLDHQFQLNTPAGLLFSTLALTWLLNLYNFMDGIDGIASIEAITVLLGATLISTSSGEFQPALVLLIAPLLGFAVWNWAPAKIFMGDGGSGFLGAVLGLIALHCAALSDLNLWCWAILLGVFIVDASWTLLTRLTTGQAWHQAHRSHAYQIMARKYASHASISAGCGAINLLWLTPLAWAACLKPTLGPLFTLLAYLPLALVCWHNGAGKHN